MAITSLPNGFIFVPRADWGARHSAGRKAMPKGITEINIHHTVTTVRSDPCLNMRNVESVLHQRACSWVLVLCGPLRSRPRVLVETLELIRQAGILEVMVLR